MQPQGLPVQVMQSAGITAVAGNLNGKFVVVSSGILARRYDEIGIPLGDEFQVNTYTTDVGIDVDVGADGGGGFVVT